MRTNGAHFSGSASSGMIASTGHSGSQAPQSMHSSGSMTRMRPASWMQSTGQTSTQERSLMSIQGSAMMYVTAATLPSRLLSRCDQPVDPSPRALEERGLDDPLVEPSGVRAAEPVGIEVIGVAEDRDVRVVLGDLVGVDPRDVRDQEIGRIDRVRRREAMLGKHR